MKHSENSPPKTLSLYIVLKGDETPVTDDSAMSSLGGRIFAFTDKRDAENHLLFRQNFNRHDGPYRVARIDTALKSVVDWRHSNRK